MKLIDVMDVRGIDAEDTMVVVEVCNTCGRQHDEASPICFDCWVAEQSTDAYDAEMHERYLASLGLVDEPVHYEIP